METQTRSPAAIAGIVGGALLVLGSFMSWATVALNVDKLAQVLGVDPSLFAGTGVQTSQTVSGLDADGKFTLVAGIVILIFAIMAIVAKGVSAGWILILLGGIVGAGVPLYDVLSKDRQIDDALNSAGPQLEQIGLTSDTFKTLFTISWSIGVWICVLGGLVAIVAGIMMKGSAVGTQPVSSVMGTGFAAPMPADPSGAPLDAPPPAPMPGEPPPAPMPSEPPTDPGSGNGGGMPEA